MSRQSVFIMFLTLVLCSLCFVLGAWCFVPTAKRLRLKARGCFNPGSRPIHSFNPEGIASRMRSEARFRLHHRNRVAVGFIRSVPRVEATLGSGTSPLRGKLD